MRPTASAPLRRRRCGWDRTGAPGFYAVFTLALVAGVALDFANVNPIRALFWSAVINGVLAPFLVLAIPLAASDRVLMRGQPSLPITRVVVAVAVVLMVGAAVAMVMVMP